MQPGEVITDRTVILCGVAEGLLGQLKTPLQTKRTFIAVQFLPEAGVVRSIGNNGDVLIILCRSAHHGGTADVDILDGVFDCTVRLSHRLLEGVEIDYHHIDRRDVMLLHGRQVAGQIAPAQNAAMHFGMQGLHSSIEHFRKARVVGHLTHRQPLSASSGSAAGRDDLNTERDKQLSEINDSGLIGNAN